MRNQWPWTGPIKNALTLAKWVVSKHAWLFLLQGWTTCNGDLWLGAYQFNVTKHQHNRNGMLAGRCTIRLLGRFGTVMLNKSVFWGSPLLSFRLTSSMLFKWSMIMQDVACWQYLQYVLLYSIVTVALFRIGKSLATSCRLCSCWHSLPSVFVNSPVV